MRERSNVVGKTGKVSPKNSSKAETGKAKAVKAHLSSPTPIVTPMPGVIVAVSVDEGDEVEKGQTLFIVSGMKMDHEIKAPIAGKVARVNVEQNDSVEAADLLALIIPE